MNCSRTGCTNVATKLPKVSFAAKVKRYGARAHFQFPLPVCDEHAVADPALYITDDSWDHIVDTIKFAGYAEPDRTTVEISFVPIPSAYNAE